MVKSTQIKEYQRAQIDIKSSANKVMNDEKGIATIANLWGEFFSQYKSGDGQIVAGYTNYQMDNTGAYDFFIGVIEEDVVDTCHVFNEGTYYTVNIEVDKPEDLTAAVGKAWSDIWCNKDLKRTYVADYELYSSPTKVTICVGIEEKNI